MGPRNRCSGVTEALLRLQERSGRLQDGSKSAPAGLKTASRALREAPGRLQERCGRPQDGPESAPAGSRRPKSVPRGSKTAPRAVREASRRLKSAPGGYKTAPRALQEAQDGPESALGGFKTTHTSVQASQSKSFLKSTFAPSRSCSVQRASSSLLEQFRASSNQLSVTQSERSEKRSKKQFGSTQLESTSLKSAGSVHSMHGFTLVYIYIYTRRSVGG